MEIDDMTLLDWYLSRKWEPFANMIATAVKVKASPTLKKIMSNKPKRIFFTEIAMNNMIKAVGHGIIPPEMPIKMFPQSP